MKKLYALTVLFSMASLQASDPLTALVQAIEEKDLAQVEPTIKEATAAGVLNQPYNCFDQKTALHLAATELPSVVQLLIKAGSNVHARDIYGETPLHCTQDPAAIRALVAAGTPVNAATHYGRTPLHAASNDSVAQTLLRLGADPNAKNENDETPLHYARTRKIAQLLISKGANPKATSIPGWTPLYFAVSFQYLDVIDFLAPLSDLEHSSDGRTALHVAAHYHQTAPHEPHQTIVGILLNAGANINARIQPTRGPIESETGNTPLHCAAESGNVEVVRLLLEWTGTRNPCTTDKKRREKNEKIICTHHALQRGISAGKRSSDCSRTSHQSKNCLGTE